MGIKPLITRRRQQWRAEAGLFIDVYAGSEQQFDGRWTMSDGHGQGAASEGIPRVYVSAVRDQQPRRFYTPLVNATCKGVMVTLPPIPRQRPTLRSKQAGY